MTTIKHSYLDLTIEIVSNTVAFLKGSDAGYSSDECPAHNDLIIATNRIWRVDNPFHTESPSLELVTSIYYGFFDEVQKHNFWNADVDALVCN